jgi:predicted GNAT family acetyltransferase
MPYMEDKVHEIGINTLPEYRGKGYAKAATFACIKACIEKGKCPIWSCGINNVASEKLAYSVGFRKLADVLTISTYKIDKVKKSKGVLV